MVSDFKRIRRSRKDGIAYKFEDEVQETVFRSVEWTPGRSGEIAPVAVFDTVEIDGCRVARASLHNISFIRDLELHPGCRILVSKRNMIIPHIEDNLDRGHYADIKSVTSSLQRHTDTTISCHALLPKSHDRWPGFI